MNIQDCTVGQAIDYRIGRHWLHGHVIKTDDNEHCPMVSVDATVYDYRPQIDVVSPLNIRAATTDCTGRAVCQEKTP